jgi:hypothetical protein
VNVWEQQLGRCQSFSAVLGRMIPCRMSEASTAEFWGLLLAGDLVTWACLYAHSSRPGLVACVFCSGAALRSRADRVGCAMCCCAVDCDLGLGVGAASEELVVSQCHSGFHRAGARHIEACCKVLVCSLWHVCRCLVTV